MSLETGQRTTAPKANNRNRKTAQGRSAATGPFEIGTEECAERESESEGGGVFHLLRDETRRALVLRLRFVANSTLPRTHVFERGLSSSTKPGNAGGTLGNQTVVSKKSGSRPMRGELVGLTSRPCWERNVDWQQAVRDSSRTEESSVESCDAGTIEGKKLGRARSKRSSLERPSLARCTTERGQAALSRPCSRRGLTALPSNRIR